jgi:seryl-tRNA synthetase
MEKQLGKEYSDSERIKFLKDNCDDVEDMSYMRKFTPDELLVMKDELSNVAIKIDDLEEEKKDLTTSINAQLKTQKVSKKRLLKGIKQKAELVKEKCFKFIDENTRMVGFYNAEGDLINSRSAMGNELQKTIFQVSKTAN